VKVEELKHLKEDEVELARMVEKISAGPEGHVALDMMGQLLERLNEAREANATMGRAFAKLESWARERGASLVPHLRSNTFGEGVRSAKDEVESVLSALHDRNAMLEAHAATSYPLSDELVARIIGDVERGGLVASIEHLLDERDAARFEVSSVADVVSSARQVVARQEGARSSLLEAEIALLADALHNLDSGAMTEARADEAEAAGVLAELLLSFHGPLGLPGDPTVSYGSYREIGEEIAKGVARLLSKVDEMRTVIDDIPKRPTEIQKMQPIIDSRVRAIRQVLTMRQAIHRLKAADADLPDVPQRMTAPVNEFGEAMTALFTLLDGNEWSDWVSDALFDAERQKADLHWQQLEKLRRLLSRIHANIGCGSPHGDAPDPSDDEHIVGCILEGVGRLRDERDACKNELVEGGAALGLALQATEDGIAFALAQAKAARELAKGERAPGGSATEAAAWDSAAAAYEAVAIKLTLLKG
jgi:hypothetical protein